jgi:hypothetical protein
MESCIKYTVKFQLEFTESCIKYTSGLSHVTLAISGQESAGNTVHIFLYNEFYTFPLIYSTIIFTLSIIQTDIVRLPLLLPQFPSCATQRPRLKVRLYTAKFSNS